MMRGKDLGIDCGSTSLNTALIDHVGAEPMCVYRRTRGRPLQTFIDVMDELERKLGSDLPIRSVLVTGSGRELLSEALGIPAVNEITAHAVGAHVVEPRVRTIIEIGGQDSKFIRLEPAADGGTPTFPVFRMNEICAAGAGAFLDEQAARLDIPIESFGPTAMLSTDPTEIAGRCAVFAKTDMIHKAQEGVAIPDILMGLAHALARNYIATLVRGEVIRPVVSLQGGVMSNDAVVHAFQTALERADGEVVRPRHFTVMGALGCAALASRRGRTADVSIRELKRRAAERLTSIRLASPLKALPEAASPREASSLRAGDTGRAERPWVLGLDIGSVSVKGVVVDARGRILRDEYGFSHSRPLEKLEEIIDALGRDGCDPDLVAVTGSGRHLVGEVLGADLVVNEISAQARAALSHDPQVDTIVEIGGQDSKWILLKDGGISDFEMNRVCAAGTGSFIMEQADRLDLPVGEDFSDTAFESNAPADLGNRCSVFMESDLIHHQNNGASTADLAAGVCVSVVHNYLERVANGKPLGRNVQFLGGVAAIPAVRAAFEQESGGAFHSPPFYKVSGALGAALKLLDRGAVRTEKRGPIRVDSSAIRKRTFRCGGCPNRCQVEKFSVDGRTFFHGGLCDRWEVERGGAVERDGRGTLGLRARVLDEIAATPSVKSHEREWGMVRTPYFYDWFPFWRAFLDELGVKLVVAGAPNRRQFERGARFQKVETCVPMKALSGQIAELQDSGISTIFHPTILAEESPAAEREFTIHCPYSQASSQFLRDSFDLEWIEPLISYEADPDSFRKEHFRLAGSLDAAEKQASHAFSEGLRALEGFNARLNEEGRRVIDAPGAREKALVILGTPYHTGEPFFNMNLGGVLSRLGVPAVGCDLFPIEDASTGGEVPWKHHSRMVSVAAMIAEDPRFFPVMLTFFGCGPDPFVLRHVREALRGKPLLVLEMDEHTSRAGITTRLEAFLDQISRVGPPAPAAEKEPRRTTPSRAKARAEKLLMPYTGDHTYGLAAAANSMGIDARVLPESDEESEKLGRPHMVGGECFPFTLMMGDYLKAVQSLSARDAERSRVYVLGENTCRLSQYPVYMEKVRRTVGSSVPVIGDVGACLTEFGLSEDNVDTLFLRGWEGMNAYDLLLFSLVKIRPYAKDQELLSSVYRRSRDKLFKALAEGRARQGMEEALHELSLVPLDEGPESPVITVTGDYFTRIVPYANNQVYLEIEKLGGVIWSPPTLSDAIKLRAIRQMVWEAQGLRTRAALRNAVKYLMLIASEFKVKGGAKARAAADAPLDLTGLDLWRTAGRYTSPYLSGGITGPVGVALQHLDRGADGVLNLMTLNCLYGTIVTAALARALKERPGVPMLTLVYDGLKKTNEKTRVEAFMEQVWGHFRRKRASRPKVSGYSIAC